MTPAERKWKAFNDLMRDWRVDDGEGNGVEVAAFADGVFISGWYDSCAAIEGGFLTWAELDELRRKAKDRPAFAETPLGSDEPDRRARARRVFGGELVNEDPMAKEVEKPYIVWEGYYDQGLTFRPHGFDTPQEAVAFLQNPNGATMLVPTARLRLSVELAGWNG